MNKHNRYVVCLKYGNKYSSEYVNKLYNMVQRNLSLDHEFVCFTENSSGIDKHIRTEPIAHLKGVHGWWYKPLFFNPNLTLQGTILFLDLDVIVFRNIDNLFSWNPGKFCVIQDFNRSLFRNFKKINSSVFRLETGMYPEIYNNFIKEPKEVLRRYLGDQDWIYANIREKDFAQWPTEWIQSYKWEMRDRPQLDKQRKKGERDFLVNGDPKIKDETSIAVFHGDPNPHTCKDKWVKNNWV